MFFLQQSLRQLKTLEYLQACFENLAGYLNSNKGDEGLFVQFSMGNRECPCKLCRLSYYYVISCLLACYRIKIMNKNEDWLELLGNFDK